MNETLAGYWRAKAAWRSAVADVEYHADDDTDKYSAREQETHEALCDYVDEHEGLTYTLLDPREDSFRADADESDVPLGKQLRCGCFPHVTRMSTFGTAVWCETEQNAYCNFECEHECPGHESLAGAHMGESVYCDGSCQYK